MHHEQIGTLCDGQCLYPLHCTLLRRARATALKRDRNDGWAVGLFQLCIIPLKAGNAAYHAFQSRCSGLDGETGKTSRKTAQYLLILTRLMTLVNKISGRVVNLQRREKELRGLAAARVRASFCILSDGKSGGDHRVIGCGCPLCTAPQKPSRHQHAHACAAEKHLPVPSPCACYSHWSRKTSTTCTLACLLLRKKAAMASLWGRPGGQCA